MDLLGHFDGWGGGWMIQSVVDGQHCVLVHKSGPYVDRYSMAAE